MVTLPYGRVSYPLDLGGRAATILELPAPPPAVPIASLLAAALVQLPTLARAQGAQRVYIAVADSVPMTVPAAAIAVADALKGAGWTVLANHPLGGDRGCSYTARVVDAHQPAQTAALLAKGATAPYAVPVRISVYEDERGVHVAMVNPLSIERTVLEEYIARQYAATREQVRERETH